MREVNLWKHMSPLTSHKLMHQWSNQVTVWFKPRNDFTIGIKSKCLPCLQGPVWHSPEYLSELLFSSLWSMLLSGEPQFCLLICLACSPAKIPVCSSGLEISFSRSLCHCLLLAIQASLRNSLNESDALSSPCPGFDSLPLFSFDGC